MWMIVKLWKVGEIVIQPAGWYQDSVRVCSNSIQIDSLFLSNSKNTELEIRNPWFWSNLCHQRAIWPWAGNLVILGLNFFIYIMKVLNWVILKSPLQCQLSWSLWLYWIEWWKRSYWEKGEKVLIQSSKSHSAGIRFTLKLFLPNQQNRDLELGQTKKKMRHT